MHHEKIVAVQHDNDDDYDENVMRLSCDNVALAIIQAACDLGKLTKEQVALSPLYLNDYL